MKSPGRSLWWLFFLPLILGLTRGTLRAAAAPDGASLFKQNCSMCHGVDGKGFAAIHTPNFTDPHWQAHNSDKEIVETIENGKKGTPMPAFKDKLKPEDIQALLHYIRSLNSEKKEK